MSLAVQASERLHVWRRPAALLAVAGGAAVGLGVAGDPTRPGLAVLAAIVFAGLVGAAKQASP